MEFRESPRRIAETAKGLLPVLVEFQNNNRFFIAENFMEFWSNCRMSQMIAGSRCTLYRNLQDMPEKRSFRHDLMEKLKHSSREALQKSSKLLPSGLVYVSVEATWGRSVENNTSG